MMQIIAVALYSCDGRRRTVKFERGLNVIPGDSKTGKSTLIEILDYCFGSGECNVPDGVVRTRVAWYGVLLHLGEAGRAFVARRAPTAPAKSTEDIYIEIDARSGIPESGTLRKTTNLQGLISQLNSWTGIRETVYDPLAGQTRRPLTTTIRHALAFCFQTQGEIDQKMYLFHASYDNWVAQALKDSFPYLLGAVEDDQLSKREQLRFVKERLRTLTKRLSELKNIQGDGQGVALRLLTEARVVGLTGFTPANEWHQIVEELRRIAALPGTAGRELPPDSTEYARLNTERRELQDQLRRMRHALESARTFEGDSNSFEREAVSQAGRLNVVELLGDIANAEVCPLCQQGLPHDTIPSVHELREARNRLLGRAGAVNTATPNIESAMGKFEETIWATQERLAGVRIQLSAIRDTDVRLATHQDDGARQAVIIGRISLYLESLPEVANTAELEKDIESIQLEQEALEAQLSHELIADRLDSILGRINANMSRLAGEIDLEFADSPLRLDIKNLTVVADTLDGAVPMSRMGSGENWVGYHLVAHLALHQWFCTKERPVPRFFVLDQPSQAHFPVENSNQTASVDGDRMAVRRLYDLMDKAVQEVNGELQIIVTDHADFNDSQFEGYVRERWRGGLKLVPEDWPKC